MIKEVKYRTQYLEERSGDSAEKGYGKYRGKEFLTVFLTSHSPTKRGYTSMWKVRKPDLKVEDTYTRRK